MVDETVDGNDGDTTYVSITVGTGVGTRDRYTLSDTPADFDTCNTAQNRIKVKQTGWVDDTLTWDAVVYESDSTTAVTAGQILLVAATSTTYETIAGTATAETSNKATWDSRLLRLRVVKSANGMADAITAYCTAVEVVMDYNTSGPAATQPYYHRTGGVPGMRIGRPGTIFGRSW